MKGFLGIFLLIVLVGGAFVPVDLPYSFESTGRVYPLQSWVLQKNTDGTLISMLQDHKTGLMKDYSSYQFDRGDVVNITFNPEGIEGRGIKSGELVANISSNMLAGNLLNLNNELAIQRATLEKVRTGEKRETRSKNQEQLRLAEQEVVLAQKTYDRAKLMLEEGLIARAEFERADNELKEAKLKVQVEEGRLEVVSTGEKPEDIKLVEAKIQSLQNQIAFQKNTNDNYNIFSPVSGQIRYENGSEGDKMIIEDTSNYVIYVPVKLSNVSFIDSTSNIEIELMGRDTILQADLIDMGGRVEILGREQVVIAKAVVRNFKEGLTIGMPVLSRISVGEVTPYEYLSRSMKVDLK